MMTLFYPNIFRDKQLRGSSWNMMFLEYDVSRNIETIKTIFIGCVIC